MRLSFHNTRAFSTIMIVMVTTWWKVQVEEGWVTGMILPKTNSVRLSQSGKACFSSLLGQFESELKLLGSMIGQVRGASGHCGGHWMTSFRLQPSWTFNQKNEMETLEYCTGTMRPGVPCPKRLPLPVKMMSCPMSQALAPDWDMVSKISLKRVVKTC